MVENEGEGVCRAFYRRGVEKRGFRDGLTDDDDCSVTASDLGRSAPPSVLVCCPIYGTHMHTYLPAPFLPSFLPSLPSSVRPHFLPQRRFALRSAAGKLRSTRKKSVSSSLRPSVVRSSGLRGGPYATAEGDDGDDGGDG